MRVAERFYREMLEAGITPDVQAMNSLINAFSKAGSPDQALQVRLKDSYLIILVKAAQGRKMFCLTSRCFEKGM